MTSPSTQTFMQMSSKDVLAMCEERLRYFKAREKSIQEYKDRELAMCIKTELDRLNQPRWYKRKKVYTESDIKEFIFRTKWNLHTMLGRSLNFDESRCCKLANMAKKCEIMYLSEADFETIKLGTSP